MSEEPSTYSFPVLDMQIAQLSELAEQTYATLQKSGCTLPTNLIDNIGQLAGGLSRLRQDVVNRKQERDNMLALAEISQVINSSLDLNEVLRIVMDTIVRLTKAERGFLMLRNSEGNLVTHVARNWEQESIDSSEFAVSRTIINRVAAEGQPVLTTNAQEDPRFGGQESIIFFNLRSILCVPLKVKDELTGVIYADNRIRTGIFSETDRNLLAAFANQAAVAIENARLFESVRRTLAEVTELKDLMDNVFASIASGVITADIKDQITLCNRAAISILGRTEGEILGRCLVEVMPENVQDLYHQIEIVRRTNKHIVGMEINSSWPDRGQVSLSLNLSPLKDASQATQGVAIVLDDLTEKKRLEGQRRLFERMVSPAVIKQLDPDELHLGGKRTMITAMFADIRGFTSFSEQIAPEKLVSILNRYLAAAAEAVLLHEGTIDKFLGDAVMAWFNAPIPQPDHTMRAVRAALGLRDAVDYLQNELPPEYHLSFGVGIHYGEAVLGLVGTEKRLEYTAIGDSINTTKRIQENSAASQILISSEAYAFVADQIYVHPVDAIQAKGKRQPLRVFEVLELRQT